MLRRLVYVVAIATTLGLVYLYVQQRDLEGRYQGRLQSEQKLAETRERVVSMTSELEASRMKAENLDKDPVEMERTVRKVRGFAREHDIVYRIENVPEPQSTTTQSE